MRVVAALEEQARQLEESVIEEQKFAAEVPEEAGMYYGNFANTVILRREGLAGAIEETEQQILEAREVLREAYRELKKYEVAQEHRDAAELLENSRQEQTALDEMGLQAHARRRD
ncbi:MAG: flagellar FliJ family protein [Rhodospirillales bacterium]|nr:flagellar FliJ family protein [Rhodospirillales bacterium]